jgi:hypothetical protein
MVKGRKIDVNFDGGNITSDGGVLLLQQAEKRLNLLSEVDKVLSDPRFLPMVQHSSYSLLKQRVFGLCQGYEDLNDHDSLKNDIAFQTAVGRDEPLSSSPTLCRFEHWADRNTIFRIHEVIVENFIKSFKIPPRKLVLDFDATDDPIHGEQEGRFFHGYYDQYCYLPLYVFCGKQLLCSYLRPSKIDGAKHAGAILKLLTKRFREEWPEVRIIYRGDSGFCRHRTLAWCERNSVEYILGIAKNRRLLRFSQELIDEAESTYKLTKEKQKIYSEFSYAADTWKKQRRVIVKAEHNPLGPNTRFIITNMKGTQRRLYEQIYCARGDMENRIKEQQMELFADRTSTHQFMSNQFRLMLSSLAYILVESIRRIGLRGTELGKAQCGTIRLKLLKIGAELVRNTRKVYLKLSSTYPLRDLFFKTAYRLRYSSA